MRRSDGHPYYVQLFAGTAGRLPRGGADDHPRMHAKAGLASARAEPVVQYEARLGSSPPSRARLSGSRGHSERPGGAGLEEVAKAAWQRGEAAGRGPRPVRPQARALGWRSPTQSAVSPSTKHTLPRPGTTNGPSTTVLVQTGRALSAGQAGGRPNSSPSGTRSCLSDAGRAPSGPETSAADAPGSSPDVSADTPCHTVHADQHWRTKRGTYRKAKNN